MVICLAQGADCLHMVQLMPLPCENPIKFKSRLVLPFWYRLTQVVVEKRLLNGCSSSSVLWLLQAELGSRRRSFGYSQNRFLIYWLGAISVVESKSVRAVRPLIMYYYLYRCRYCGFLMRMFAVHITGVSCPPNSAACLITSNKDGHWCVC